MKICVLLASSKRLDDRTARIVTTLADAGHNVSVVFGLRPEGGAQRTLHGRHVNVRVISCARFFDRLGLRTIGRCCAWVLSLVHAFAVGPDVVHAIGYRTLRRGQLLTLRRASLVYDAPDGIDCNRRRRLERRRLGAAAGLIAGSKTLARELAQRAPGGATPLVVRDTPDPGSSHTALPSVARAIGHQEPTTASGAARLQARRMSSWRSRRSARCRLRTSSCLSPPSAPTKSAWHPNAAALPAVST